MIPSNTYQIFPYRYRCSENYRYGDPKQQPIQKIIKIIVKEGDIISHDQQNKKNILATQFIRFINGNKLTEYLYVKYTVRHSVRHRIRITKIVAEVDSFLENNDCGP